MRFMTFEETQGALPISLGYSGDSGTGKTYSALLTARGMAAELAEPGAPIAFVDTENRRGLHYRDSFPEMLAHYVDFGPENENGEMVGFPPDRIIDLIDYIEDSDAQAVVFDSFTHPWEGINGHLELQAQALERLIKGDESKADRMNQLSWAEVKPPYRRLINRIIRAKKPIILCTRAKPVMQKNGKNARPTKTRKDDIPFDIASDRDLMFELTAQVIMDPKYPGTPKYLVKCADGFRNILLPDYVITEATGRDMARWSKRAGEALAEKALMDAARAKAREGRKEMREWWGKLSPDDAATLKSILPQLQEIAAEAEARVGAAGDPFAEPGPSPEEMARVAAQMEREAKARTDQEAEEAAWA